MINCSTHNQQLIGYSPTQSKPICNECQQPSEQIINFNGKLPDLKQQFKKIQQHILQQFDQINIKQIKQEFENDSGFEFIQSTSQISKEIELLEKQQALFWILPQVRLIFNEKVELDWKLLRQYQIVTDGLEIDNCFRIKQYLQKKIKGIKKRASDVRNKINQQRQKLNRYSEPFEDIVENNSSGSEANDVMEVGVPDEVKLEQLHQQLTNIIQNKKEQLVRINLNRQESIQGRISPEKQTVDNIDKKDNNSAVTTSQGEKVQQSQHRTIQQIQKQKIIELIVNLQNKLTIKNYEQALSIIQSIIALDPNNSQILQLKTRILLITNNIERASQVLSKFTKPSTSVQSKYDRAFIYLKKGMYTQCKALIDQLFSQDNILPEYYILKGDYLLNTLPKDKPSKELLQCYTTALEKSPKNKQYLYRLSIYSFNHKQYDLSLKYINQSLEIDPTNLVFLKTKSWLNFKLFRYRQTIIDYKQIRNTEQTSQTINNYAIYLFFNKQQQQAKNQIYKAYIRYPLDKIIILNTLVIMSSIKQYNQAFEIVKQTFQHLKFNETYIMKCCEIALEIDSIKQARTFLEQLQKVGKENKNMNKQFYIGYYSLALYLNDGDAMEDGISFFTRVLEDNSNDNKYRKPEIYNLLGLLKVATESSTGLEEFKLAISCCLQIQLKCSYFWNCSIASYKEKKFKESLESIEKAIELEKKGKKPKYLEFRIFILIKNKDYVNSLRYLQQMNTQHPSYLDEQIYENLIRDLNQFIK